MTTRRSALLAVPAAALSVSGLAACTQDAAPSAPAPVNPDVALREAAAERERALLQAYDEVLRALPELGARLLPLHAQHGEHLDALARTASTTTSAPASPSTASPSAASPSSAPAPAPPPPASPAEALAALAARERAAGDAHGAAALTASRELAGLLASLSASELSHPVALQ